MSQSLSQLYVHIIFHTKGSNRIREIDAETIYSYIGGIINKTGSIPIRINGMPDHIHILCILSKNASLAGLIKDIKSFSSKWMKDLNSCYSNFEWQRGYAGFSVSQSICASTIKYITNQAEHHKRVSFREEYVMFLKKYNIEYDETYLWND